MLALKDSEVHIWYRSSLLVTTNAQEIASQYLSIEERAHRDRLRFGDDRRDFTIAHDLLRRVLSNYGTRAPADWQFVTDEYGKPTLESDDAQVQPLAFSLSHTRGCVACAITTASAPLGIDIERIGQLEDIQEIADRYFSDEEAAWLRECPDELRTVRFTEGWTLKEAFLKATGVGLSGSLANISFRFHENARIEFSTPPDIESDIWHFALFEPDRDVRVGVAIQSTTQPCFLMRQDDGDGSMLAPILKSSLR